MRPLLIRADGGPQIGAGHLMRCLALAEAWQEAGGAAQFATTGEAPAIEARLQAGGMPVARVTGPPGSAGDATGTIELARAAGAEWIVVDGYGFGGAYQDALRNAGFRVLFLDDYGHASRYSADLVLNQNLPAEESLYRDRAAHTGLLLGPRFALLRREFTSWPGGARPLAQRGRKILVTLGGADAGQMTATVIEALGLLDAADLEAVVVVGPANPLGEKLRDRVAQLPFRARTEHDPSNMPALMVWADLAISAAGSTCWELALMGAPTLAIVCADNQAGGAGRLHRAGAIESLGDWRHVNPRGIAEAADSLLASYPTRTRMREKARELVDGRGARRVIQRLLSPLRFREVREEDCRLLWDWANDADVRAAAFASQPIPWSSHVQWFRQKRLDPLSTHWVALDRDGSPVGQVRFDPSGPSAVMIDVSVARAHRAKGYGGALLDAAVVELLETADVKEVHALVKIENRSSLGAFRKAHFRNLGRERVNGCEAEHLVRRKEEA